MTAMKLKVNLHITNNCNYRCRYCFAHFNNPQDIDLAQWKAVVDNLKSSGMVSHVNFAGGEPLLYRGFAELLRYTHEDAGMDCSVITNGSLLLRPTIVPQGFYRHLSMLGISVDSCDHDTLLRLGCADRQGRTLSVDDLHSIISKAKAENPDIHIKFNTVVTSENQHEVIAPLEKEFTIDRWKFLKMKLFETENFSNQDLLISEAEYKEFLARNELNQTDHVDESSMERSYIIIDNCGNLIDNKRKSYEVVGSLLEEPFAEVFGRYSFDSELYGVRYRAQDDRTVSRRSA